MQNRQINISFSLFGVLALLLMSSGCKTSGSQSKALDATNPVTQRAEGLTVPVAGSTDNPVNKSAVIKAWRQLKQAYYEDSSTYTQGPMPPTSEINECLSACPDNWSDLACHYYSHTPSYRPVVPNVRGCFTRVARGQVLKDGSVMKYPDIYDYCVYQDFDAVLGRKPDFDQSIIDTNKAAGDKPGVMKWIDDNQTEVFKYVMFPVGYPFTWDKAQEQETINEFYGVDLGGNTSYSKDDAAQVTECKTKRGRTPYDPFDGTHCSYTKVSRLRTNP